jgi:hypothetical protein
MPDEEFDSQHGHVTYKEWCAEEIQRLKSARINVAIRQRGLTIALFRTN